MFNKKDLVKQIKYESVNSLISNAQAADWAVGAWAPQPTKGTGSPSSSTAKTGPSKATPSSQSAVFKMQQKLKSLPENLNFKINPNIKKYFIDNFFNKSFENLSTLKADNQWWGLTDNALQLVKTFLNGMVLANTSLNLEVDGLNEEISGKMNELLSGYEKGNKGRVLLPQNELEKRAEELNQILEKIPSFYQNTLKSLQLKYGNTIVKEEVLDDYSEKVLNLSESEQNLLNSEMTIDNKKIQLKNIFDKKSMTEWIQTNYNTSDQYKIMQIFEKIKNEILNLKVSN